MIVTRGVGSNAGRKRVVSGAVSLVLLTGLAAYGARAFVGGQGAPVAGFAAGNGQGGAAQGALYASSRRMPKTEMEVAVTLSLTNDQMARFKKHDAAKTAALDANRKGKPCGFESGVAMNKWWNDGLKSILTTKQYARYCAAWHAGESGGDAATVFSPAIPVVGRAHNGGSAVAGSIEVNPADALFGGKEKEILASLALSDDQATQVDELYARIDVENQKLREIWKGDDPMAVGRQGSKINKMQNDGMKAILTPEQHEKYMAAWGQAMKPYVGKGAQSARRPVVGGKR